ncbi:MAG: Mu transposase C-terminal domain-containing protein, partial [Rhodocyclaceae bacterium]|nr:Mu transposase C-terminal domain-containing protein [Rhodocyclaceae bacterium]
HLLSSHLTVSSSAAPAADFPAVASNRSATAGLSIPAADLTDKQRAERDARKSVLAAIRNLQARTGCSQEAAMTTLLTTARAGKLEPVLDAMLHMARDPRGRAGDGYPSMRTLKRWLSATDLAPKLAQKEMTVPAWAPALMKLYGQPQKPSLSACMDDLPAALPAGVAIPSYDAANRFLKKLGNVERQRGRRLSRDIKNLLPFVRRDASGFAPDAIYTADGHCFDAEVAHPRHGKAFRPEITTVLSVSTRRCVGWSAGLAESTWAVMDAMRHAAETASTFALWYVDNGSGFKNDAMTAEVTGFVGRIGGTITNSLPYNSQARGVEERSHKSIWVRGSKKLPTYMGADMDRQARQKVFKLTRADIKATGTSKLLMAWDNYLRFCQDEIDAYNNRPHKALPKLRDPETGKPRHQTPNEAWQQAIDEGWEPSPVTSDESADLFRPEVVATTIRGEIRLHNHLYFSHDLTEFTGDKVRVGYDLHDASKVWVRDMDGRLICIAEFEANKRRYFPESFVEQAQRRRTEQRANRLETHLQEVREELDAPALLEHQPTITVPLDIPRDRLAIEVEAQRIDDSNVVAMPGMEERPWLTNDPDQYRWLMRNPAQWTSDDAGWLLDYTASDDYADLAERYAFQGVAWGNEDEARARAKLEGFEVAAG